MRTLATNRHDIAPQFQRVIRPQFLLGVYAGVRMRCSLDPTYPTLQFHARRKPMPLTKPGDGEVVWIEYPEGRHLQAVYHASSDTYSVDGQHPITAADVANWSYEEHEDTDISDWPTQPEKGKLARD
jgi:hypothetical protein